MNILIPPSWIYDVGGSFSIVYQKQIRKDRGPDNVLDAKIGGASINSLGVCFFPWIRLPWASELEREISPNVLPGGSYQSRPVRNIFKVAIKFVQKTKQKPR